ncbi:MAG: hypothetical protein WAN03_15665, partial [Candidatus Sulfotelmatobacter sp.]
MHMNESRGTLQLIGKALDILEQDGSMTLRQLFWRLTSAGEIHNDAANYHRLTEIMTELREEGRCRSLI